MASLSLFAAFVAMAALAAFAVLWPLGRARPAAATGDDARAAGLAVYRDQMEEIARDARSGRLPPDLAEAARTEIARRMIAADRALPAADAAPASAALARRRLAAATALVLVPLAGAGIYAVLGSPDLPGAPLAARLAAPPDRTDVAIMVRRVEEHLAQNPNDGRGYEILAPIYLRLGRMDDAARAFAAAARILGPSPDRYGQLGEALVAGSGGMVGTEAVEAFRKALALDPADMRANYFLGLAAEQDGRPAEAARIWEAMLARAPAEAPFIPMLKAALARVGGVPQQAAAAPGPSAADVAAAADLSADDRNAMVRGMVARLEDRLKSEPDDLDGWLRLARALTVLGQRDQAAAALIAARTAFADQPEALARIDAAGKSLAPGE